MCGHTISIRWTTYGNAGNEAFLTETHDAVEEQFVYSLGDIDGEGTENSPLNAKDAAKILIYAAMQGSGAIPDWNDIINE